MSKNKVIAFYLFIAISSTYLLASSGSNIDYVIDQQMRFATTRSIVEKGDLSLPEGMGIKGRNGKDYSWYGIGQPLLAIPFYIIGKHLGGAEGAKGMVSMLNLLAVSLSGVIMFLFIINIGYSSKTALTVTIFYAFGTLAWPQSKQPFDHPVETIFLLLAIFFAHLFVKGRGLRYLILSAASVGYAFIARVPSVLALPPLFLYLLLCRHEEGFTTRRSLVALRDFVAFSIALVPFGLIQLWYNYARFGSIFETGYQVVAEKAGIDFFNDTPLFIGLSGFLISPGKGFFYYSPISILIFVSIKSFYKRNKGLTLCIGGIVSSYLIFLSRNIYWHGDWSWGPRYLLVITPLLMVPIADFVERLRLSGKKFLKFTVFGLFTLSVVVQVIAVSVDFNRYFFSLQEKGVRFTSVGGKDMPIIYEPSPNTHFDWDKFPIGYQAGAALKIWNGLRDYRFVEAPEKTYDVQVALTDFPRFNVFDFWWLYALYTGIPPYTVLLELTLICLVIILSWFRVLKLVDK